jgi:PAS domain-containing protein
MEPILSSQILLIADKNLRITEARESACVGPSRAVQTTALDGLLGKSIADSIPGLDPAEALDACKTIVSGGRFPGGFAAYRKTLMLFDPEPERRVILLSPHSAGLVCRVSRIFLKHPQFDDLHLEDYKAIVENCMEFVVLVDQLGFHTYISPMIQTTMGALPEEVPGIHMSEVQHPDDVETSQEKLDQAARDGLPVAHFQYRLLMPR